MTDATLSAKVTADIADFNQKMGDVQRSVEGLGKGPTSAAAATSSAADSIEQSTGRWKAAFVGVATAVAAGALKAADVIGEWTRAAAAAAEKTEQISQQTGIAAITLESWSVALNRVGVDTEAFAQSFKSLSRDIEQARGAADFSTTKFAEMGLSLKDLGSTETVIRALADKLATMTDPAQRAQLVIDLLGKEGLKLLPALMQGSAGLDAMAGKARQFGLVLDESSRTTLLKYDDALDDLGKAWQGLTTKVAAAAAPILLKGVQLAEASITMAGKIIDAIVRMVNGVEQAFARLGQILTGVKDKTEAVAGYFLDLWNKVSRHSYVPDMVDQIDSEMSRLKTVMVTKSADGTEKVKLVFAKLKNTVPRTVGETIEQTVDEIGQHVKRLDSNLTAPSRRAAISTAEAFQGMTITVADALADLQERSAYTTGAIIQNLSSGFAGAIQGTTSLAEVGKQVLNNVLSNALNMILTWTSSWLIAEATRVATTQGANAAILASTTAVSTAMVGLFTMVFGAIKMVALGLARTMVSVVATVVSGVSVVLNTISTIIGFVLTTVGEMLIAVGSAMQSIPIIGNILGAIVMGMGALTMAAGAALPGIVAGITAGLAAGVGSFAGMIPAMATGGIVTRPTLAMIGEAGPEAVVPLSRSFGQPTQQTIIVQLDGNELMRYVANKLIPQLRLRGAPI